jgi:hypothetical protein
MRRNRGLKLINLAEHDDQIDVAWRYDARIFCFLVCNADSDFAQHLKRSRIDFVFLRAGTKYLRFGGQKLLGYCFSDQTQAAVASA